MKNILRPVTEEFDNHETRYLPQAQAAVIEFQERGEPIVLWTDHWRSDYKNHRSIALISEEREQIMLEVFRMCGLPEDFHPFIRLLKKDSESNLDDKIYPNKTTFGEHKPSLVQIFNWLGDFGSSMSDYPNNFDVGFAIDAPVGLVVVKFHHEEDEADENFAGGGYAQEEEPFYEMNYQIALYPKEQIDNIFWYAEHWNPRP